MIKDMLKIFVSKSFWIVIASVASAVFALFIINYIARLAYPEPSRISDYITAILFVPVGVFVIVTVTKLLNK